MKKISCLLFFCWVAFWVTPGLADTDLIQRIEIPSSFNPVGSGARALGMGGAFIAVADDATAASWNPGGLVQLELPEISVVGSGFYRTEDNDFSLQPEASGDESVSRTRLNYLSAACPFTLAGRNMTVSLNYQHLYDFTREWQFPVTSSGNFISTDQQIDYEQTGQLAACGLAYSAQITPDFSAGMTLNFWEDGITSNRWKQTTVQKGSGISNGLPFSFESRNIDRYDFSGFNMNFGFLWNITPRITLGGVLKTPFTADVSHERTAYSSLTYPDDEKAGRTSSDYSRTDEELEMPLSFGIGIACKFSNELTGSLDIYRTEWDDFELKDAEGNKTSPVTGKSIVESGIDPTHQVRLGLEYLFRHSNYLIPVRGGIFYDPAPAQGSPDDFFGFSIGSGVAVRQFTFDVAYQYRFGNNVGEAGLEQWGLSQDIREHTVYSSVIVHF